ncbi:SDR family oxidoreductase [uncultured Rikenella sp.]|uniref:NAD-dependent epimerase/dehydratase family protein n=1 Tax=uncultured Rikenella sp. TaxID=368003 RepID=UPI0025DB826F|nr:SDR family oxidoreductase [uncultured Rikenella sp.]
MITKGHILITGGNGYIGARLSLHLADAGYAVTPVCYPAAPVDEAWRAKMERIVVGDVRDEQFLRGLAQEGGFDAVVHLVSLDHRQSAGDPASVAGVNITPTWSLLDIFSKAGLKKFVYFSTVQVYGVLTPGKITEQHPPQTRNAYALTHWIGEQICDHYNRTSSTQCRVVRLSNSYGAPIFMENNCWWLVVNDLCRMTFRERRIVLQSDGTPQRDFIHGWDVCRAVERIIATEAPHTLYQISSGTTLTIMEIAQTVQQIYAERYSRDIRIESVPPTGGATASDRYTIDNSLLRSIGYTPEWDLRRGIEDLFDYLEQHDGTRA